MKTLMALILITFANIAVAQNATQKSNTKLAAKEPVEKSALGLGLSYGVSSNLNSPEDQKLTQHRLKFGLNYAINPSLGASAESGLRWFAEGQNIRSQTDNPSWEDLSLSLSQKFEINKRNSLSISFSQDLPTGNESRLLGIRGTSTVAAAVQSKVTPKSISWTNLLSYSHLFHTYDVDPVSLESNVLSITSFSSTLRYRFLETSSIALNHTSASLTQINGENRLAKNRTGISLGTKFQQIGFTLGYEVGNYLKNDNYRLLYVSDTQSIISAGVNFEI